MFFGLGITAFAQTTSARLEGSVQDPTGAVIPNAKVIVVNTQTQVKSETTTNTSGYFLVTALQAGNYNLTVEAPGFRAFALKDIVIDVGASVNENVKLEVGQTSESVQVEATTSPCRPPNRRFHAS